VLITFKRIDLESYTNSLKYLLFLKFSAANSSPPPVRTGEGLGGGKEEQLKHQTEHQKKELQGKLSEKQLARKERPRNNGYLTKKIPNL
jgi:hypothetical protein